MDLPIVKSLHITNYTRYDSQWFFKAQKYRRQNVKMCGIRVLPVGGVFVFLFTYLLGRSIVNDNSQKINIDAMKAFQDTYRYLSSSDFLT